MPCQRVQAPRLPPQRPVAVLLLLPLVSEEVASAPAPSDMAQRMMCVSWLCVDGALCRLVFSVYCGIDVPYSAVPMCQLADALRFGHVGAFLSTIWYVPVHLLPYRRGIDPSERSYWAAYGLQQPCLVRPCVIFTNSASHLSERWHRGCLQSIEQNYLIALSHQCA